jgi:uncharacterized cupin superfamily protein
MSKPVATAAPSHPAAPVVARDVPPRAQATHYPPPFAARMQGREKRPLGDRFGLRSFGVNLTTLAPGAQSALKHRHSAQDEFVFVVSGTAVLIADGDEYALASGMCSGFAAGGVSHHLVNRGTEPVVYLEIGDRNPGDEVFYPDDDIQVRPGRDGKRRFEHKDGTAY